MELGLSVDGIDHAYGLSCLDFVTGLDRDTRQLAVECKVFSVLDKHTLSISRHHKYVQNFTVEDTFYRFSVLYRYVNTFVGREFQIFKHRMELPSKTCYNCAIYRPWKFTLIVFKLTGEFNSTAIILLFTRVLFCSLSLISSVSSVPSRSHAMIW